MKKTLFFLIFFGVSAAGAERVPIIEHLRATYNFPAEVEVILSEPKDSKIPGFNEVTVTFRHEGKGAQSDTLYISKDGRYYSLGGFMDLSKHPDKERMEKIRLKDVAVRGPENAPVTVVEYTDFQCPFCERGYRLMVDGIMKEFKGKVKWVYKSLPLRRIHPWAAPAAEAVECVRLQDLGKFWTMHDYIFDNQRDITNTNYEDKLAEAAKLAGADEKKYNACMDSRKTQKIVTEDEREAVSVGLQSTPSFLVNGRKVAGADYQTIRRLVEEFLAKGKKK